MSEAFAVLGKLSKLGCVAVLTEIGCRMKIGASDVCMWVGRHAPVAGNILGLAGTLARQSESRVEGHSLHAEQLPWPLRAHTRRP